MTTVIFLVSQLVLAILGAPAYFHRSVRNFPVAARLSAGFLLGAVLLTTEATLLSLMGIRWHIATMALPLIAVAIVVIRRRTATAPLPWSDSSLTAPAVRIACLLSVVLALAHLAARLMTGRASSVDYLYFWGVKAIRFLDLGGIEHELLAWIWGTHTHPNYPQLFPITLAWGGLLTGQIPWLGAVMTGLLWMIAAVPLLWAILRLRLRADSALLLTSFWTVAVSISLAHSLSGGNAEPMLVVFTTVAVATVLVEKAEGGTEMRWLGAIALSGAVLTKMEGWVIWPLLVVGVILRDLLWKKSLALRRLAPLILWPAGSLAVWIAYCLQYGIPLRDTSREPGLGLHFTQLGSVLSTLMRYSSAGSFAIPWVLSLVVAVLFARRAQSVLPGLTTGLGLLAVFLAHYLQYPGNPSELIGWTFPRISQPAMSALILSAGLASEPE